MNAHAPRRVAVVPAYNEEAMVFAVLEELYPRVDHLVVVDDGSVDNTRSEIERFLAQGRPNCELLVHETNQGMSEAYFTALTLLRKRLAKGELDPDDLVFTVDADGQHDLHVLNELVEMTKHQDLDANLARRDLSYHGAFKRTGNWILSRWASLWAGARLHDVESGYRIFRLGAWAHALDYYSGYQYSETVEVAVVMCQLGYRVRNDHMVPVPVARSRTRMRDAAIDLAVIPVAASRVWRTERAPEAFRTDVAAHLSIAAVLGMVLALTYRPTTSSPLTLLLAAIAAFGLGAPIRRSLPRPALALLGPFLAGAAAWLVPQRPDRVSAIILCAVFGTGAALAAPGVRRPRPTVIAAAFSVLIVVRLAGTRASLLGLCVLAVVIAAFAARFGRVGLPRGQRLRTLVMGTTLVFATSSLAGYFGATTVGATWFGGGVTHGSRSVNEVALTFDDGPNVAATPAIMRILDRAHVKGTFFVVGTALDAQPEIVRALYADGQLVGNHAYHHDQWRWLDPRYPEVERTQQAFARELGTCPAWFRPPNGQKTPLMAHAVHLHRMRMAMWDVSADDDANSDPQVVADRVLREVKPGSIIDLHDGAGGKPLADRSVLVATLPLILDGLHARHLQPVRLDQLVGGPAYEPCPALKS